MNEPPDLRIRLLSGQRLLCGPRWAEGGAREFQDPFGRLYLIHSGEGVVIHSRRHFHLRPGSLFVIPAHVTGRYRCPERMDLSFVHFDATLYGSLEPFESEGWDPVASVPDWPEAERLMHRAIQGVATSSVQNALAADGAMRMLLSHFARWARRHAPAVRFAPVFRYIDEHLGERLTLAELAAQVHLQPNYFSNRFTEVAGLPPMRFVTQRRVEAVATRLRTTHQSLAELASAYGFSDAFHLSKVFKRLMGVPPSRYRQSAWREDTEGARPA